MDKEELKTKKRDINREENAGKPVFKLTIEVDSKENIEVNGPINNMPLFMKLIAAAINTVIDYNARRELDEVNKKKGKLISLS